MEMISNICVGGEGMDLKESLAEYFKANADFSMLKFNSLQYQVQVIGLDSLVDLPQSIASLQTQTSNLVKTSLPPAKLLKILGELVEPKLEAVIPDIMKGNLIILEPSSGTCAPCFRYRKVSPAPSLRLKRKVRYTAPATLFGGYPYEYRHPSKTLHRTQPASRSVHGGVKSPQVVIINLSGRQDQPRVTAIHPSEDQSRITPGCSTYTTA